MDAVCGYRKLRILRIQRRQQLMPEWNPRRLPEFGSQRDRRCGAREDEWLGALGSWEHAEDDSVLGRDTCGF